MTIREPDRYQFNTSDFDGKTFEKYYRSILIVKYYSRKFADFNDKQVNTASENPVTFHITHDKSVPEGDLFEFAAHYFKENVVFSI